MNKIFKFLLKIKKYELRMKYVQVITLLSILYQNPLLGCPKLLKIISTEPVVQRNFVPNSKFHIRL